MVFGVLVNNLVDELVPVFGVSHPPLVNECNYNVCLVEKK